MEEKELNAKFKKCKTAEEVKTLAKEIGYELSDEEAEAYFKQIKTFGELGDDELGSVSGGGCTKWRNGRAYSGDGLHLLIVTIYNKCPSYTEGQWTLKYKGYCPSCFNCKKEGATRYCMIRSYYEDKYNPYNPGK